MTHSLYDMSDKTEGNDAGTLQPPEEDAVSDSEGNPVSEGLPVEDDPVSEHLPGENPVSEDAPSGQCHLPYNEQDENPLDLPRADLKDKPKTRSVSPEDFGFDPEKYSRRTSDEGEEDDEDEELAKAVKVRKPRSWEVSQEDLSKRLLEEQNRIDQIATREFDVLQHASVYLKGDQNIRKELHIAFDDEYDIVVNDMLWLLAVEYIKANGNAATQVTPNSKAANLNFVPLNEACNFFVDLNNEIRSRYHQIMGCPPPTTQNLPAASSRDLNTDFDRDDNDGDNGGEFNGDGGDDQRLDLMSMLWTRWEFSHLRTQLKLVGRKHDIVWKEFRRQYRNDINSVGLRAIKKSQDVKRSHKETLKIARKQIQQQANVWNRFKGAPKEREDLSYWLVLRETKVEGAASGFPDEQPTPGDGFKKLKRKVAENSSNIEPSDTFEDLYSRKTSKSAPVRKKAREVNTVKDSDSDTSEYAAPTRSAGCTRKTAAPTSRRKIAPKSVKTSTQAVTTSHRAAERSKDCFALRRMVLDIEEREFELQTRQQRFLDAAQEYQEKYGVPFDSRTSK